MAPNPGDFFPFLERMQPVVHDFAGLTTDEIRSIAAPTFLVIGDRVFVRLDHVAEMLDLSPTAGWPSCPPPVTPRSCSAATCSGRLSSRSWPSYPPDHSYPVHMSAGRCSRTLAFVSFGWASGSLLGSYRRGTLPHRWTRQRSLLALARYRRALLPPLVRSGASCSGPRAGPRVVSRNYRLRALRAVA